MDFIIFFPKTSKQHNSIIIVVEGLSKVAHLIPVMSTNSASEVSQIFIREIVRLLGVPKKIVSNRDAKFTSRFSKDLFIGLGIDLAFCTTYYPQIDGYT